MHIPDPIDRLRARRESLNALIRCANHDKLLPHVMEKEIETLTARIAKDSDSLQRLLLRRETLPQIIADYQDELESLNRRIVLAENQDTIDNIRLLAAKIEAGGGSFQ